MSDPDSDDYWNKFKGQIDNVYLYDIGCKSCIDIFSEAWRCYKEAEAYLATCIMCRNSVEGILHFANTTNVLYRIKDSYGPDKDDYPSFTKLFNWAKSEHLLDGLYRIAGNEANLNRAVKKLKGYHFIREENIDDQVRYYKTEIGEMMHEVLKSHDYLEPYFEEMGKKRFML